MLIGYNALKWGCECDYSRTRGLLFSATDSWRRWTIDCPHHYGTTRPPFGFASAPLLVEGSLYVQAANGLVKVDCEFGRVLWRTAFTDDTMSSGGAFSSPILTTLNGIEQVVVFTRTHLNGVDPESGRVLWQHVVPNFHGMNIIAPSVYRDGIFVSQYRNGSYFFRPNGLTGSGQVRMETAWTNKASGYMSSPVVIDDHVYQHLGNGRLSSIDPRSGEENWRTRPLGEYWSMAWQGDRILAMSADGSLRLVRATPERFELLDEREAGRPARRLFPEICL
jgi:outer membrane protein assembly factor BamB